MALVEDARQIRAPSRREVAAQRDGKAIAEIRVQVDTISAANMLGYGNG